MDPEKQDRVLEVIENTLREAREKGFEEDRIAAILHRTELGLKYQSNNFGVNLILALTPGWNHDDGRDGPLRLLRVQENVDRFKEDLAANPRFLQEKVEQYFVENTHKLVLVMSPSESYTKEQQDRLDSVEEGMTSRLTAEDRMELLEKGRALAEAQAAKEDSECLPSLKVEHIPERLPTYAVKRLELAGVPTQLSAQPTNEVSYFKALLDVSGLSPELRGHLPLFAAVLTSLGAGPFDYRRLETLADLRTGGLGASLHVAEDPGDLSRLTEGLLLGSHCLEKNAEGMFELWTEVFNSLRWEGSLERLRTLVAELATDAVNGVAMSGHHYAMGEAARKLRKGMAVRAEFGGLDYIRLLAGISRDEAKLEQSISGIGEIARILLNKDRMKVALNATPGHAEDFSKAAEGFLSSVPGRFRHVPSPTVEPFEPESSKVYCATSFPIHYCSTSVPTVHFLHEDYAALSVASKLLYLKYLHREIREKGGAYGGGALLNSGGVLSFFSYRDPAFTATLDTFEKSLDWVRSPSGFDDRDVEEAKLGVFQKLDEPVLPGARGLREFLTGVTDGALHEMRARVRSTGARDVRRAAERYLDPARERGVAVIGPEDRAGQLDESWKVHKLV